MNEYLWSDIQDLAAADHAKWNHWQWEGRFTASDQAEPVEAQATEEEIAATVKALASWRREARIRAQAAEDYLLTHPITACNGTQCQR
jgi:hypothetical protein